MTTDEIHAEFLQRFPAFTKSLLDTFPDYFLNAELVLYGFADTWGHAAHYNAAVASHASISWSYAMAPGVQNFAISAFSPSNPIYTEKVSMSLNLPAVNVQGARIIGYENFWTQNLNADTAWLIGQRPYLQKNDATVNVDYRYDTRLFSSMAWQTTAEIRDSGGVVWFDAYTINWPPHWMKLSAINSITLAIFYMQLSPKPYNGFQSLIDMYENGVDHFGAGLVEKAYSFNTLLTASKNYGGQIESAQKLLVATSEANLRNYQNELNDKAETEIQNLQISKLQIFQAIDNEARSAQRDYATQLLTAKNIQLNLRVALNV